MLNLGLNNEGYRGEILVALVKRVETCFRMPTVGRLAAMDRGAPVGRGAPSGRVLIPWLQGSGRWLSRSTSCLGLP